jgi:hypothetical protein
MYIDPSRVDMLARYSARLAAATPEQLGALEGEVRLFIEALWTEASAEARSALPRRRPPRRPPHALVGHRAPPGARGGPSAAPAALELILGQADPDDEGVPAYRVDPKSEQGARALEALQAWDRKQPWKPSAPPAAGTWKPSTPPRTRTGAAPTTTAPTPTPSNHPRQQRHLLSSRCDRRRLRRCGGMVTAAAAMDVRTPLMQGISPWILGGLATVGVVGLAALLLRGDDEPDKPSQTPTNPAPAPTSEPAPHARPTTPTHRLDQPPPAPHRRRRPGFDLVKNWGKTPTNLRPLFALMERLSGIDGAGRIFATIAKRESAFVATAHNDSEAERKASRRAYDNMKDRNPALAYGMQAAEFGSGGLFGALAPYFLWTGVPEVGDAAPLLKARPRSCSSHASLAFAACVYLQRLVAHYRLDDHLDIKVGWASPSLLKADRGSKPPTRPCAIVLTATRSSSASISRTHPRSPKPSAPRAGPASPSSSPISSATPTPSGRVVMITCYDPELDSFADDLAGDFDYLSAARARVMDRATVDRDRRGDGLVGGPR